MDLRERRELNSGFGESLSRAFELALTPAIFAGIGWLIDGWLGTRPLFLILLFALVMGYEIWKMFLRYDRDMREHERTLLEPKPKADGA